MLNSVYLLLMIQFTQSVTVFVLVTLCEGLTSWPMVALRWRWVTSVLRSPRRTEPCGCPGTFSMWWTQWWWKGKKTTSPAATLPAWSGPTPSSWPRPSPLSTRAPQRTVPLFPRPRWDCSRRSDKGRTHYRTFMVNSKFELISDCFEWLK